jgi:cysteine desulfurase
MNVDTVMLTTGGAYLRRLDLEHGQWPAAPRHTLSMLYLDHAATTPMRPEAREAMEPFLGDVFGNPSGVHAVSRRAKDALEDARERAAALLGARHPLDIVFTGGGTESDNLGVKGPALAGGGRGGVVVTAVEHEAVLEAAAALRRLGCEVSIVGVDGLGRVDPGDVALAVAGGAPVVSVMAANNETGVVQPVAKVAEAARAVDDRVVVHCDAVQAFGSMDVDLVSLGVDLLTVSSHKVGGPKGVGVLALVPQIALEPVIHGGGQELGRRSGTHDVAGIVGMVAAMEAAAADRARLRAVAGAERDAFESVLEASVDDAAVTAKGVERLAGHSHVRVAGVPAETLLILLDAAGLAASAGSACQSGAVTTSHVLRAMGMPDAEADECVRFTFGWTTVPGDGERAARIVARCVEGLR